MEAWVVLTSPWDFKASEKRVITGNMAIENAGLEEPTVYLLVNVASVNKILRVPPMSLRIIVANLKRQLKPSLSFTLLRR